MVTNPCISLATNPANLEILLQSTSKLGYQSTTGWPSFDLYSTVSCPHFDLLLVDFVVDLFDIDFSRSTSSNFDLMSIHLEFDCQSIYLDSNFTAKNITTQHELSKQLIN
jgi:hypothetical protein